MFDKYRAIFYNSKRAPFYGTEHKGTVSAHLSSRKHRDTVRLTSTGDLQVDFDIEVMNFEQVLREVAGGFCEVFIPLVRWTLLHTQSSDNSVDMTGLKIRQCIAGSKCLNLPARTVFIPLFQLTANRNSYCVRSTLTDYKTTSIILGAVMGLKTFLGHVMFSIFQVYSIMNIL